MDKKSLSEADICTKFITPAVVASGWDLKDQIRQEVYFTAGKIIVNGNVTSRGERKRADYILYYRGNIPIAIIEAKDNNHEVGSGMQQGLSYAETLDIPFVYSSNGDAFIEHDRTGNAEHLESELPLDKFPSPSELWLRYKTAKGISDDVERVITSDYYAGLKKPRYYQEVAINRTVEAISKGQDRILLVMATGTGKTYVASQIIYKLWKSKQKKRILFLADRNILVDQARNNDFKHFGGAMTKIANRKADTSYEIYLALYQAVSGAEEWRNIYKQFTPEFFDLVIVDECHRGSAADDSAWREVLDYFQAATQIGMTATPKEDSHISNIEYFGEPIYTYSLKEGIEDGFLAPYSVVRISIDKDIQGYKPEKGQKDKYGYEIPSKIYDSKDFDKSLVIDERTELVARKVTEYLTKTDRMDKTIVFCVDIEHAERMRRALVNENKDMVMKNPKYVVRITGDDEAGKKELDNFLDPSVKYPVIVTTSKLLNTGVDAQTCKLVVLDSNIESMTEFKQIIGRGTRVREDYKKTHFAIMDFRQVTNLFADPDFDGEPVQSVDYQAGDPIDMTKNAQPPQTPTGQGQVHIPPDSGEPSRKYYVNGVEVKVVGESVQLFDKEGNPLTQTLEEYTKQVAREQFGSLDGFLQKWNDAEFKSVMAKELIEKGIFLNELHMKFGNEYDDFDLVCHVAFEQPLRTRDERAEAVRSSGYFSKYDEKARAVVNALLDKYAEAGIGSIEALAILKVNPFTQFGTPLEIVGLFSGKEGYLQVIRDIEARLYSVIE
jgi:type I restriction enzyme, R subunit